MTLSFSPADRFFSSQLKSARRAASAVVASRANALFIPLPGLKSRQVQRALRASIPALLLALALPRPCGAQTSATGTAEKAPLAAHEGSVAIIIADNRGQTVSERPALAAALSTALESAGFNPLLDAKAELEERHSAPAQKLTKDIMQRLRERIDDVTRDLAMGDLPGAVAGMEAIDELHHGAMVRLNRESKQARRLFTACVAMGVMLEDTGKAEQGLKRLHHCAVTFPGFRLSRDAFSPDAITLYQQVLDSIDPVVLRVDNLWPQMPCTVRYNGLNVGSAPAQLRVHRGQATVQLECADRPGRVHTVPLQQAKMHLGIDPRLEQALTATPTALHLRYDSSTAASDTHSLPANHGQRLVDAVQADFGLLVRPGHDGGYRLTWLDATAPVAARGPRRPAKSHAPTQADWDGQPTQLAAALAHLVTPGTDGAGPPNGAHPETSLALDSNSHNRPTTGHRVDNDVAYRPTATSAGETTLSGLPDSLLWAWPAVGVAYGVSVGIGLINLQQRGQDREYALAVRARNAGMPAVWADAHNRLAPGYDRRGQVAVIAAALSNTLFVSGSALILPPATQPPWWAYVSGGVGLALLGTGAVMVGINSHCPLFENCTFAGRWDRDATLPALLMIHAAGPLSVPLTYLLASALSQPSGDIQAQLDATPTSATLRMRGRF